MSKYGNRQAVASDGKIFPSKRECKRYEELLLLQRIGAISHLETQVRYELIPKQDGERAVYYIADFVYREGDKIHIEDTKGFRTKEYILKRKLMLHVHGIRIEEI